MYFKESFIEKVNREIRDVLARKDKLLDLRLDESITKDKYELKNLELCAKIEELKLQLEELQQADTSRKSIEKRIAEFKKVLLENKGLTKFDRAVFESIVEKVIVGGFDENGAKDPQKISFVYKTGFKDDLNGRKFRSPRKVRVDKKRELKGYRLLLRVASLRNCAILTKTTQVVCLAQLTLVITQALLSLLKS